MKHDRGAAFHWPFRIRQRRPAAHIRAAARTPAGARRSRPAGCAVAAGMPEAGHCCHSGCAAAPAAASGHIRPRGAQLEPSVLSERPHLLAASNWLLIIFSKCTSAIGWVGSHNSVSRVFCYCSSETGVWSIICSSETSRNIGEVPIRTATS